MSRNLPLWPLAALAAACLSACGGSDSAPAATTSGVVTGSYFEHAKVCIDANNNAACDSSETAAYTDANGAFTLTGLGAVVAEIGTDAFRNDGAGGHAAVTRKLVFRAPASANGVISAISTELAALMDANGGNLDNARNQLATRLGIAADKVLADHNKETDSKTRAALQAEIDQAIDMIADAVAAGGDISVAVRDAVAKRIAMQRIKNVVVIYAENRGFDNLYGLFPGADGVPGVNPASKGTAAPQTDFDGSTLASLPPTWGGFTATGQAVTLPQASTVGWANKPFRIDDPAGVNGTGVVVGQNVVTRDLVHRFYNNQMQINGGKNDKYAAYSDAGGLVMGYYDGSAMAMWKVAQQYTLADNFYMGTFGGSFLNHQYLVCACAPTYPNAESSPAAASVSAIDVDAQGNFVSLSKKPTSPASILTGTAQYVNDSTLTAKDGTGVYYAVNTMQPPYQPSGNAPVGSDTLLADPGKATTLPAQTQDTIATLLDQRGVSWAWYAGAWKTVSADRTKIYNNTVPNFQAHHQPFNYYAAFSPVDHADYRAGHLKDFDADFLADAAAGKLPAVSFYKPQGDLNQHPGYADVAKGDAHIADVISKLQASPQWKDMLIVVTYDENGGFYDHAQVPRADRWGPGTRIPAIVVSPYARKGFVDHTQYDTASVLRFITHRFALPTLPGLKLRDQSLIANGKPAMGDLSNALTFPPVSN
ncbi:acid phosphatase [Cupriavidus campinensis]